MVKIRLARVGTKKTPIYRVVVTDSRSPRDGKHIEFIGLYDPRAKDVTKTLTLDHDRLNHWRKVGAKLSEEVTNLVKRNPAPSAAA
ncbi:MAG: ribosomal protein [Myxococcaceae bacterium]|nr:ribosomal protein [Myxococcaceae bacterium]